MGGKPRLKNMVVEKARVVFSFYAAMNAPDLPFEKWSRLQVQLHRWQARNFGGGNLAHSVLGVAEEAGELAHAVLKHEQGIRGMDDREAFKEAAGDAIADCAIYLIQCATLLRLDFGTLVFNVAREVMERDWKKG